MPHMFAITGSLGAGKTTFASIFAHLMRLKIERIGGNLKLFANYDLQGAERLKIADDWFKVADAHGSLCLWDEAHIQFDSRRFARFENIFATEILTFARKMASVHVFITPSINRIDTRIRDLVEVLMTVRGGKKGISVDFYDYQADFADRNRGKYLYTRYIPGYKIRQVHQLNLFDSHSFVSGFPLPKTEKAAEKFMFELENRHDMARWERSLDNADDIPG